MTNAPLNDEQLETLQTRLELWAGLTRLDRAILDETIAASDPAREALAYGYLDVYSIRDDLTKLLIDAPWSHDPETLARLEAEATRRGYGFTPPAEQIDLAPLDTSDLRQTIARHYLLDASDEALHDAFRAEPDLYAAILELGDSIAYDTLLRESLSGALTTLLVGRSWPTYGEGEQAQRDFLGAIEREQRPGYLAFCSEPSDLVQRAGFARDRGDTSTARDLLDRALAADPNVRGGATLRADLALSEDDPVAALAAIGPLFAADQAGILAHLIRGKAYAGLERTQEAVADLTYVTTELDPSRNRRVLNLPADAYDQAKDLLAALQ